jgi:hypothetical protein
MNPEIPTEERIEQNEWSAEISLKIGKIAENRETDFSPLMTLVEEIREKDPNTKWNTLFGIIDGMEQITRPPIPHNELNLVMITRDFGIRDCVARLIANRRKAEKQ